MSAVFTGPSRAGWLVTSDFLMIHNNSAVAPEVCLVVGCFADSCLVKSRWDKGSICAKQSLSYHIIYLAFVTPKMRFLQPDCIFGSHYNKDKITLHTLTTEWPSVKMDIHTSPADKAVSIIVYHNAHNIMGENKAVISPASCHWSYIQYGTIITQSIFSQILKKALLYSLPQSLEWCI